MKTRLTPEESQHLISLGVPKEKASCHGYRSLPRFTLKDFLNGEIFPKEIEINDKQYNFVMYGFESNWYVDYLHGKHFVTLTSEHELIDALYQLACWYYGEYLKSEKK